MQQLRVLEGFRSLGVKGLGFKSGLGPKPGLNPKPLIPKLLKFRGSWPGFEFRAVGFNVSKL